MKTYSFSYVYIFYVCVKNVDASKIPEMSRDDSPGFLCLKCLWEN